MGRAEKTTNESSGMWTRVGLRAVDSRTRLGFVVGLVLMLGSLATILVAWLLSPSYDPLTQTISELGTQKTAGSIVFMAGMTLNGFLMVAYAYLFVQKLGETSLIYHATWMTGVAGLALVGLALLPTEGPTELPHFLFALAYFFLFALGVAVLSRYYHTRTTSHRWLVSGGYSATAITVFFLFAFPTPFGPVVQKITVMGFMAWHLSLLAVWWKEKRGQDVGETVHKSPVRT